MTQPFDSTALPEPGETASLRWAMFSFTPQELLELTHLFNTPDSQLKFGAWPPDVTPLECMVIREHNLLAVMLQSDFFDPVEVSNEDGAMRGEWLNIRMALQNYDEDDDSFNEGEMWSRESSEPEELPGPMASMRDGDNLQEIIARGLRLRGLTVSAGGLLSAMRLKAADADPDLEPDPDAQADAPQFPDYADRPLVVEAVANDQIGGWTLILESEEFEPAELSEENGAVLATFDSDVVGDSRSVRMRIVIPGAGLRAPDEEE